jgi:hypothetical protein
MCIYREAIVLDLMKKNWGTLTRLMFHINLIISRRLRSVLFFVVILGRDMMGTNHYCYLKANNRETEQYTSILSCHFYAAYFSFLSFLISEEHPV